MADPITYYYYPGNRQVIQVFYGENPLGSVYTNDGYELTDKYIPPYNFGSPNDNDLFDTFITERLKAQPMCQVFNVENALANGWIYDTASDFVDTYYPENTFERTVLAEWNNLYFYRCSDPMSLFILLHPINFETYGIATNFKQYVWADLPFDFLGTDDTQANPGNFKKAIIGSFNFNPTLKLQVIDLVSGIRNGWVIPK